jgi:hypothetical protein
MEMEEKCETLNKLLVDAKKGKKSVDFLMKNEEFTPS